MRWTRFHQRHELLAVPSSPSAPEIKKISERADRRWPGPCVGGRLLIPETVEGIGPS